MTSPGRRAHVKRAKVLRRTDDAYYHPDGTGSLTRAYKQLPVTPFGPAAASRDKRYVRLANAIRAAYRG